MPTVAEQLRQARESQNRTIYEVAEVTKIRTDHIRALEAGDYEVFSAPVYIRGFVRTYAMLLKLDERAILAELSSELAKSPKHHEPPPLTGPSRSVLDSLMFQLSKVNWRIAGPVLGVVIVLAGGFAILRMQATHKLHPVQVSTPAAVYQPAKKAPGDTLPIQPPPTGRR
jgi:cytoskeleton protein RodZ